MFSNQKAGHNDDSMRKNLFCQWRVRQSSSNIVVSRTVEGGHGNTDKESRPEPFWVANKIMADEKHDFLAVHMSGDKIVTGNVATLYY
jgi:hypothetical protein